MALRAGGLRRWRCAVALGAAASAPVMAQAAEPVSLAWNAPPGCPTGDAVLGDVNAILGGPTSHHASARADVTQLAPQHWSVHVTTDVDGAQGERTLEADSCESLAKATALILAWAVDPIKARAAVLAAQPPAPPAPETPPSKAPSSPIPLAAVVAVSGMGDIGTLQSPAGAAEVSLGALVGPLRFELSGDFWGPQHASTTAANGVVGAQLQLLEASLRACLRWRIGARFELDPCAGGALLDASSKGYSDANLASFQSQTHHADWGALRADLLAGWRLVGPFALRASVGAAVQPTTPSFSVEIGQTGSRLPLHQPGEIAGQATLGVEAHFP